MSKKQDEAGTTPLPAGVRSRIAKAFIDAYAVSSTAGGIAGITLCKTIASLKIPKTGISDADMDAIVVEVARPRGWKRGTYAARKSEMRTVMTAAGKELQPCIDAMMVKTKACGWSQVVRLARLINKGEHKTTSAIVTAASTKSEGAQIDTVAKATAHVEKTLKRLVDTPYLTQVLRQAILKFAVANKLNIGATA